MKNNRHKQLAIASAGASTPLRAEPQTARDGGPGAWWLRTITVPMKAFQHSRTALRNKRNGFTYSAALEWRHAAELFAPNTLGSEYCWLQWERIMHLPRRLADPIGVPVTTVVQLTPASATRHETTFPLAIAA